MKIISTNYEENKRNTLIELSNYYNQKHLSNTPIDAHTEKGEFIKTISFVAKEENIILGRIVGFIDWTTYSVRIEDLIVNQSLRGKGVGKCLVNEAEKAARQDGCRMSFVDTTSSSAPIFYQKLGYMLVGKISDYPMKDETYYFYYKNI